MKEQRRGQKIAMTPEEIDTFLADERTVRLATVGADGTPHNSALWFVWDGKALWLNSLVKSQRWTNAIRDARASAIVDGGVEFMELRGVELIGRMSVVGDVPRTNDPDETLAEPERRFGAKYGGGKWTADGRHAWLRLDPEKIVSWDFRKMGR